MPTQRRARLSVVTAFALHAAIAGSLGPRLPAVKARTGVSDAGLGTALVGFAVGLFLGTRLAAWPIRRFGSRGALRVGLPAFAASLIGPALARDLLTLTISLVVMGVASGLVDVAMNANAVVVERRAGRPIMSSIHGVWSCGLLATSAVAAGAAAVGASPLQHFGVVAVVLAPASAPVVRGLLDDREDGAGASSAASNGRAVPWAAVIPLGVIGFCSFLGEGAMHDWAAVYLRDRLDTSAGTAALGFTGFALGMTVSRFVADALATRFGPVRLVRVAGLVAAGGLTVGLLVPTPLAAIAGFTVLGAALAPVVPTVFSAAGNVAGAAGATSLGWVVTLSYVGGILGPALIGFTARAAGLRLALGIAAALALVISALAGRVGSARLTAPVGAPSPPSEGPW